MILADTSIWIDYFNGVESLQIAYLDSALLRESVLMGDIILTEILQGFVKEKDFKKAKSALIQLDCFSIVGKEIAIRAASNYRFLKSKGVTIRKTVDMLIATWCIETEIELLHNDKDFDHIAKYLPLKVIVSH